MQLDEKIIAEMDMSGRGGGEKKFAPALSSDWKRVSASLYDFINEATNERLELKKQKDAQWFDGWKYYNLSPEDQRIIMLFVVHDGGRNVVSIHSIPLGDMIKILLNDDEYNESGWTAEILEIEYNLKKIAPKRQSKLQIKVKKFVEKYENHFTLHYERV
jgi:hypothetical protein